MKQSVKVILWVAAFILILGGAYFGYQKLKENYNQNSSSTQTSSSVKKNTAANFIVYDADGNEVKLSSKFGKPIVLNFWATWCSPCKSELPGFDKVYAELGDQVEFMMVNVDGPGTEADVKAFLTENGYTFPVYYDNDYSGVYAYNVSGIPISFFINANGNIMATQYGAITESTLRTNINDILN